MTGKGDNDTSVQPQTHAMGTACREPGRGEMPMCRYAAGNLMTSRIGGVEDKFDALKQIV